MVNRNVKVLGFVGFGKDVGVKDRWEEVVGLLKKVDEELEDDCVNNGNLVGSGVVVVN